MKKNLEKREEIDTESISSNIMVCVRVRPLSRKESETDNRYLVHSLDSTLLVLMDPLSDQALPEDSFRSNRSREKQYAFDMVFDKSAAQDLIFTKTTRFLIDDVANGYNATVFAYGATGAGKTHTMIGESDCPGLMILTFEQIFESISRMSQDRQYKVRLSYLEIYNEEVRDLLVQSSDALDIREDSIKGITIAGLSEVMVTSPIEVISLIRTGNKRRTCEATLANETSSRSHAVLQIIIEYRDKASGTNADIMTGKLSLIDLAGSERASSTKNRGIRLLEGANINRSLLALGNCINALCENSEKGSKVFVPYRDSKLTRLLKDSLGGNCKTVMIACVSPAYNSFEDTHNTLAYANRAKNIKTSVQKNVVNVQFHISKYTSIISQLRLEINDLRSQLHSKRNMPTASIEKYLIVLNTHFQEEAKTRKNLHQFELNLTQLGFSLYSRQIDLPSFPDNSDARNFCLTEIENLKKAVQSCEVQIQQERAKAIELEKKRQNIENSWTKLGIDEPYLSQLTLELKKNALSINSLEYECKESQNKAVIEQKDQYIKLLEEQLRIRDSIIDSNIRNSPERTGLKSFEEIAAQSVILGRDCARSLPPISHSRIPRPKNVSPAGSVRSKGESSGVPSLPKVEKKDKFREGRRRRYAHKIRSSSTGSSDSDESNASSYVKSEKRAQVRHAIKSDMSSYVNSRKTKPVYKL